MITLHATKKLFSKLPLLDNGQLATTPHSQWLLDRPTLDINPLSGWHGNVVSLQGRNCVLLVHNSTRFPLVLPALTKLDFAELNARFADSLLNTLLKCEANEAQLNAAERCLQPLQVNTQCLRSEQSTLTRIKLEFEQELIYNGTKVGELMGYSSGAWIASMPRTIKDQGTIFPATAMLSLLTALAETITN